MKIRNFFLLCLIALMVACAAPEKKRITVLYTTDEHGWFVESEKADGAAALMQIWKEKEGFSLEADSFLVLSGGDMWTGASPSTWFKGQSMFEVMSAMGYDAAAVGNHEFDFGLDTLKARAERSAFPFLAANILDENGETASFAKPYHIVEANGVKVGLLGLANIETPNTTQQEFVEGLTFAPYADIIRKNVPEMKNAGAQVIIIVGHICKYEMHELTALAAEFNIPLITGGHCHEQYIGNQDGVEMIQTKSFLSTYIKVVLEFDPKTGKTVVLSSEVVENKSEILDQEIGTLVSKWEDAANVELSIPIAYTSATIKNGSEQMNKLVMTSWAEYFPEADLFMTNQGSIRQDIETGDINIGDIIGLLPFNNVMIQLNITGKEINDFISRLSEMRESYVWGKMSAKDKFVNDKTYKFVTNDFLYSLDENKFKEYDPKAYNTGVIYREPLIDYLKKVKSSVDNPLDKIIK